MQSFLQRKRVARAVEERVSAEKKVSTSNPNAEYDGNSIEGEPTGLSRLVTGNSNPPLKLETVDSGDASTKSLDFLADRALCQGKR